MSNEQALQELDVWLRHIGDEEEAESEANTYKDPDGGFNVEWYHNAVGQVSSKWFATRREARRWLESEDFQDFST